MSPALVHPSGHRASVARLRTCVRVYPEVTGRLLPPAGRDLTVISSKGIGQQSLPAHSCRSSQPAAIAATSVDRIVSRSAIRASTSTSFSCARACRPTVRPRARPVSISSATSARVKPSRSAALMTRRVATAPSSYSRCPPGERSGRAACRAARSSAASRHSPRPHRRPRPRAGPTRPQPGRER